MKATAKKTEPELTLTEQIAGLTKRKYAIESNQRQAEQTLADFEHLKSEAETRLTEAVVNCMADQSEENALIESDARVKRDALVVKHLRASEDLKHIPAAVNNIKLEIKGLDDQKKIIKRQIVEKKIKPRIEAAETKAVTAVSALVAAVALERQVPPSFASADFVTKHLNKNKRLTIAISKAFDDLEKSLKFEEI